jgi:SecD/SecF fusion protein
MEKQKRWQLAVILAVIVLTVYNILPTVFFYSKPLKEPVNQELALNVANQISTRVNNLTQDSIEWVNSYGKHLGLKNFTTSIDSQDPRYIEVKFEKSQDASIFKRYITRAGLLIPFVPSQIELAKPILDNQSIVKLQRRIGVDLPSSDNSSFFSFVEKRDNGKINNDYKNIIFDRATPLLVSIGGTSTAALILEDLHQNSLNSENSPLVLDIASKIVLFDKTFSNDEEVLKNFYGSFTQTNYPQKTKLVASLQNAFEKMQVTLLDELNTLNADQADIKAKSGFVDSSKSSTIKLIEGQQKTIELAKAIVTRNQDLFNSGVFPLDNQTALELLESSFTSMDDSSRKQSIDMGSKNPFISSFIIDWSNDQFLIELQPQIRAIRSQDNLTDASNYFMEQTNQLVFNEIAKLSRQSGESITPLSNDFFINLNTLNNSSSLLVLDLTKIAKVEAEKIQTNLKRNLKLKTQDLSKDNYPVLDFDTFRQLPAEDSKLAFVVYTPSISNEELPSGFKTSSIYVIARSMKSLSDQYIQNKASDEAKTFTEDFNNINQYLSSLGFFGYPAQNFGFSPEFKQDYIFELNDYYGYILKATREQFNVHGSKKFATLDFTDVEQRILMLNRIEDSIHDDLLKWKDSYMAAQVDLNLNARLDVPPPSKNVFWENFKLSFSKYFRGDDRKILKWGLDLSGGKTVRIGLRDQSGKPVNNPDELKEGANELYKRVNKLGVSEVGIRVEGKNIILDFPGSQNLSASELIKASAMTFNVVNEKFSKDNLALSSASNNFLQEVWNEAVVTNKKSVEDINQIAFRHLGGSDDPNAEAIPQSESAKILYENGLRLPGPNEEGPSAAFNDTLSQISMFRGDDFVQWQGQSHPLIITFYNYAVEGSSLEKIQVGYDPSKGNFLSFDIVKNKTDSSGRKSNAQEDLFAWSSQFSQEKIAGTPNEAYSGGKGWRMAVILNGSIISSPTLNVPIKDHAMITGHFSQRELNQLAADLKAGSLTYVPKILSEENVSPELGTQERFSGILAAALGTFLVIAAMCLYYRFAGVVASIAVLFLLLIMWGVLQNLEAALTLPGIAGIILTVGMAVDANVLVYERIREEFSVTQRLPSAVQAGYRKAFSAIIDSNITTVIAALILLQFDSGPIKGFALTLIIGIVASMFTALFMTRYFFAGWVQNPKNKSLSMASFIGKVNFNFLSKAKVAILASIAVIVVGGFFLVKEKNTLFGMDFTGGYALHLNLPEKEGVNYKEEVYQALIKNGAKAQDFQIRELNTPHNLKIQFGTTMDQPGHPFYGLPLEYPATDIVYNYQINPRLAWIVDTLKQSSIDPNQEELSVLEQNFSEMSGQLSDTMRNNAIIALALAMFAVLIYITIRFEFKYAISAIIGLAHDVLITLAILGMLHTFEVPIQIDLQVIAAIMTIIGYSLNDTIIIFDRIREDLRILRKLSFSEIVNHALNATLSRTIMTSGTTLLVLLALVIFGGPSIFNFALVMTIGVVVGTLSSLFVAAPLLLYFHNKEIANQRNQVGGSVAKASSH